MDSLKNFISENRPEFDDQMPSEGVWERIAANVEAKKTANKTLTFKAYMIKYAAAAVVLLALGGLFGYLWRGGVQEKAPSEFAQKTFPDKGEFAETEQYYDRKISFCKAKLETLPQGKAVLLDLAKMDRDYQLLQDELSRTKDPEKVLHAMIDNSRKRLSLLEMVLGRLESRGTPQKTEL